MTNPKALYIHIPFCEAICGYCDFTRFGYNSNLADQYLLRLAQDFKRVQQVETIYIGGGTPTALSVDQLTFLLESIKHLLDKSSENTIEANPDSITDEKINLLLQYGINRVSLGVQSTDNFMLAAIGRTHSYEVAVDAVNRLRSKGLTNISLDFIYGLPQQTLENVKTDLQRILELKPVHLSLYSLTIEPNSAFGRQKVKPASNDLETEMYRTIVETLKKNDYQHYEISNFCLEGYQSEHNKHYWFYDDFYGIGIGASGKENHTRYTNTTKVNEYLNQPTAYSEVVKLSLEDEMFEQVMMSLRLEEGLSKSLFKERFNRSVEEVFYPQLKEYFDQGYLIDTVDSFKASEKGRMILGDILVEIL